MLDAPEPASSEPGRHAHASVAPVPVDEKPGRHVHVDAPAALVEPAGHAEHVA